MQKSFLAGMLAKTVWRVVEEDSSASGRAVPPQHACAQQGCARQARIPLPFMGDGRDTARAVLFLASEEARFITGTEIVVDGGMSVRCD